MNDPTAQHNLPKASLSERVTQAALWWTPMKERGLIQAWLAWARELARVRYEITDPHVAQTKLLWWREQLALAYEHQAAHPSLQALVHGHQGPRAPLALGLQYIDAWCADLSQSRYLDNPALLSHAQASGGSLAQFCIGWIAPPDAELAAYAHGVGTALRLGALLRTWGWNARLGLLYIPIDDLQTFGIKAHQLLAREASLVDEPSYQKLMAHQHASVLSVMSQARALRPRQLPLSVSGLPIALDLEQRALELIAAQRFAVHQQLIELPPWQIHWQARKTRWHWRHRLR